MKKQFNGEFGLKTPEKKEDQLYEELIKNTNEQDHLIKEMKAGEAKNIQELMTQMDSLIKKGKEIWEKYKEAMEKSRKQEAV